MNKFGSDNNPYEMIASKSVLAEFYKSIKDVSEILEISPTCARLLLALAHWDTNETIAFFHEHEEPKILQLLGVTQTSLYPSKLTFQINEYTEVEPKEICPKCFNDTPPIRFGFLHCGHRFCASCWARFVENQVSGDANSDCLITCMEPICKQVLEDGDIPKVAADPRVSSIFQKSCEAKFLNSRSNLQCCRGADCDNIAVVSSEEIVHFKCPCGNYQCSSCGKEGHEGIPCWLHEKWLMKFSDNHLETLRYLTYHTKPCPKCNISIEKDGGWDVLICPNCHTNFCWLCGSIFNTDIYMNNNDHLKCTIFPQSVKSASLSVQDNRESKWDSIERSVFYLDRSATHITCIENEKQMINKLKYDLRTRVEKIEHCVIFDDFFKVIIDVLIDSRRTLSYSCGFLYFVRQCAQQEIFCLNLASLEADVEQLSTLVKKELTLEKYSNELRLAILSKCRLCQFRRQNLINHLVEGFKNKWWEFNPEL